MDFDTWRQGCDIEGMPVNPETTVRKNVALPKELWEQVRAYRFRNEINTESGAIRQLVELGLDAAKGVAAKGKGRAR
jgi:hypothetical protein